MITYGLFGTKGGVGTSTAAVLLALELSRGGKRVVVESPDCSYLLPIPGPLNRFEVRYLFDGAVVPRADGDDIVDFQVYDFDDFDDFERWPIDERIAVVDGTYTSLARGREAFELADRVLLVQRPGSALTRADVSAATRRMVTVSPWSASVMRAGDAGILEHRGLESGLVAS